MNSNSVHVTIQGLLYEKLLQIESYFNADVLAYNGPIYDGVENGFLSLIEELTSVPDKKEKLIVVLTTTGGSVMAVERYVNIIRQHYSIVEFVVPDCAYSAGTIFCMSGDNIHMDYFSVLGPIDPQVQNKDGNWVAALGYLDKVNEAIERSKNDTITELEFGMVKDLDLADLRMYEQAKDLTIQLLKKWLVKYKFKDWDKHQTTPALLGKEVTLAEKECRAEEIAKRLNKNDEWNSHGRPINIETLKEMGLKIEDYSSNITLRALIRDYYDLQADYVQSNKLPIFVQTKKYI
jgi:membrane-bound ClpP family serine protease